MKFNHRALFVLSSSLLGESPCNSTAAQAVYELQQALHAQGFQTENADNLVAAQKMISQSPAYSSIAIYWDNSHPSMREQCEHLLALIRERNPKVPMFLMADEDISAHISLAVMQAVSEYIYLYSETPAFTANRIRTAVLRYAENLLPPYFNTLKNFTEDGDYYWDCPGHMGGMAYLKHPVGIGV